MKSLNFLHSFSVEAFKGQITHLKYFNFEHHFRRELYALKGQFIGIFNS